MSSCKAAPYWCGLGIVWDAVSLNSPWFEIKLRANPPFFKFKARRVMIRIPNGVAVMADARDPLYFILSSNRIEIFEWMEIIGN
jgi:hypothetical protein